MQRWVRWGVVSNNLWVLMTADLPQRKRTLMNSSPTMKNASDYSAPEISIKHSPADGAATNYFYFMSASWPAS